jgi:YlmC/YmxH family sporulation protein
MIKLRLSQLGGKEIIDIENGERMGMVGQADLSIDENSGFIDSLILPSGSFLGVKKKREAIIIPWHSVKKIGPEMMIVELRQKERVRE